MEASATDLKDRIRQFVTTAFYVPDPTQVTDTTSFLDTGIVDSTGVLEIISFLQSEFGVTVEDNEILPDNLDSVDRIAAYIRRKTGSPWPPAGVRGPWTSASSSRPTTGQQYST